jgi:uncharacterized protein (TIGR04255 family)
LNAPLYPNQPLTEVATEVRFKGNLLVETIRADFQSRISEEYPVLLVPGAKAGIAPPLQPYRFERQDGLAGVQLAINSFSYYSREYPGHKSFLAGVEKALSIFSDLVNSIEVTRIGWRYINEIPFTREDGLLPLDRFFREDSIFGDSINRDIRDLSYKATLPINDKQLSIKLDCAKLDEEMGEETFLLDIDAFDIKVSAVQMQTAAALGDIAALHTVAYDAFESLISEDYRAFLKGGNDG